MVAPVYANPSMEIMDNKFCVTCFGTATASLLASSEVDVTLFSWPQVFHCTVTALPLCASCTDLTFNS